MPLLYRRQGGGQMTTCQDHHPHKRSKGTPFEDQTIGLAVSLAKQPDPKMTTRDSCWGWGGRERGDKVAFYEAFPESHNIQLSLTSYPLQPFFFFSNWNISLDNKFPQNYQPLCDFMIFFTYAELPLLIFGEGPCCAHPALFFMVL